MTSESESAAPGPQPAADAPPEKQPESWWSFLRFLLILLLVTLFVRSCVVAPFSIPSGSMLPNLLIGDYLFVSKWPYGYSRYSFPFGIAPFEGRIAGSVPDRGDIVVFRYPGPRNEDFVKRVIGVPGDTVALRGGHPIVNGQPIGRVRIADFLLPVTENMVRPNFGGRGPCGGFITEEVGPGGERLCRYPRFRETLPGGRSYDVLDHVEATPERCARLPDVDPCPADNFGPVTVPEGHVLVLGDNRDDSLDGRFPVSMDPNRAGGVGMVPLENLQGRAFINFFSTDGSAEWLLPWTWFSAARWDRIGDTYP